METLTSIQNKALNLLAAGRTEKEVAAETGVGARTISRWKTNPHFKALLSQASAAMYDMAVAELVAGSQDAAKELKRIISDPDVSSKTKISAINVLLSNAARAKESILERRLERLEENLNGLDTEQDTET